ncbi:spfh domain band 7 family protein [Chrysochromulina tobinii]|uniref:Spfh domain band 7 family protein n=1 Tax=Chrysochromulina tobinii TaxID=1460289 RepID=A0A0M0J6X1_9EUKA|nr:spfh domain band 7 family protein [Chrysochromulina tobinii]|eukprot:KOO22082.1 spfh domain band 7 family protein [Chrysochromulina sp. CCMP291]
MAGEECMAISVFIFVLVPSILLIALSFATLEPIEYALNFNAITMSLENETYSVAGLYFLGFGHWFIRFPRTIQTIEFLATGENSLLHTRTSDGLPLTLGLSFQYRYQPQNLYNLYLAYKGEHHQGIAASMQISLNDIFTKQLFASIDALQISQVELPAVFQEAILESISTKQNITHSERYKENMEVTFTTQRMVAQQEANMTVIAARGVANQKLQQANANAQMTEQTVAAEMAAYTGLSRKLTFSSAEGLDYLWWDTLQSSAGRGQADGKEFLVGLDPAAYIRGDRGTRS